MYHSVTFSLPNKNSSGFKWRKNTYDDFHLVSDGRPVIATPEPITQYIEVPGASGRLDMSESLTNYPLFGDREGSLSFLMLNDYSGGETWANRYQELCRYIHGRHLEMYLEDDPDYFYEGRFSIEQWESSNDGGNSSISIKYTLDTYKYWDNLVSVYVSATTSGVTTSFSHSLGNLGSMPVIPTFKATSVSGTLTITATNPEISSSSIQHTISSPATYQFQDIVLSDFDYSNTCTIKIAGSGSVTITLRNGEL